MPERIRWWSVRSAVADLVAGAVTASAQIQYLTAFLVVELIAWGVDTEVYEFSWDERGAPSAMIGGILVVVKVAGPVAAYVANGGKSGLDFLGRFFVLSLPIRARVAAYTLLLALPLEIIVAAAQGALGLSYEERFRGVGSGPFLLIFNAWHYWWLAKAIRPVPSAVSYANLGGSAAPPNPSLQRTEGSADASALGR